MKKIVLIITMLFIGYFSNAQNTFFSPFTINGGNVTSGSLFSIFENSTQSRYVFSADKSGIGSEFFINSGIGKIRTSGSLHFSTYTSEAMVLDWYGNLCIGTQSPGSYKLAVAGKIAAAGEVRVFQVGTTTFPDYVFEADYKLPALSETEAFVKANKHLPEVPSAKEIEKDGMSLNEMNTILLKKVEELTLYMIEQNKEIIDLKERLKKVEKK